MKLKLSHMLAVVSVSCLALGVAVLAQDSNIGTWKLNVAKSKFSPGPALKGQTLKIEPWGADGVSFTSDGMDADGKPTHFEFQAKYDGKDMPVKGNPDFDTLAYKRIDANAVEATTKLKGKVTGTGRVTVSADGKTRTVIQTGTNAKGEKMNNTLVYEKQ